MVAGDEESLEFATDAEYREWIESEDWYQTIDLTNGMQTAGKQKTNQRYELFRSLDFRGKSVIDVGCNSGQYSLLARQAGARKVIGIDPDEHRIRQARTLAANEGVSVDYRLGSLDLLESLETADIILCIAVLSEIEDVFGSLRRIKHALGERALLEMGLAKPVLHLSANRSWWQSDRGVSRLGRTGECVRHRHAGWVFYPSLDIVRDIFGSAFDVVHRGKGLRYEVVEICRR